MSFSCPRVLRIAAFYSLLSCILLCGNTRCCCQANKINVDERHSYSLTTFDPTGRLGQVQRAAEAAALGTPVIGLVLPRRRKHQKQANGSNDEESERNDDDATTMEIVLASPQLLPSPWFTRDDGTSRFARVSQEIVVAHSGLSADGRVLAAAAQRLAVSHEYTFDEDIPIELFLQEMSLLFQEYTIKAGARPFGATLIVAYCPSFETTVKRPQTVPQLYRIDPSGTVLCLGNCGVVNGNLDRKTDLLDKLKEMAEKGAPLSSSSATEKSDHGSDTNNECRIIANLLRNKLAEQSAKKNRQGLTIGGNDDQNAKSDDATATDADSFAESHMAIITASLSQNGRFVVQRHEPTSKY